MISPLRIGCVKYRNARPLIHGWEGGVEFDDPSVLGQRLAAGELDLALVSSFEFLRNPVYRIVDGISISSDGPVYSVIVAHFGELAEIEEIALDPASLTSVALLRCLIAQLGLKARLVDPGKTLIPATGARLLIGDQAIRFRREYPDCRFWDLGQEWKRQIDLPFVYALWLARPDLPGAAELAVRLRGLRNHNLRDIDRIISAERAGDPDFLRRYYCEHLRFNFGAREKQGLQAFAKACANQRLIRSDQVKLDLL